MKLSMNTISSFCFIHFIRLFSLSLLLVSSVNAQVTDTIHVEARWNMVSVPLKVQDNYYLSLFPGAISEPFEYNTGYPDHYLRSGKSYWIKFASADAYIITGEAIQSLIKDVTEGWNMNGSISDPITVSNIKSDPPGIVISDFFEYNAAPGYEKSDTIKPGSGYWVKVNQSGKLILSSIGYPCPGIPTVEYEGKTYNSVQIGDQCWLKENLDVGMMVDSLLNQTNNSVIEKYCYRNDTTNCDTYGGLYQWDEAMQYPTLEGAKGICPSGWHIPTYSEFQTCTTTVNRDGNALKAIGQGISDGAGTNVSGFSALLAGYRNGEGYFYTSGIFGMFWSSTGYPLLNAYYFHLIYDDSNIVFDDMDNKYGFSVRCLKD